MQHVLIVWVRIPVVVSELHLSSPELSLAVHPLTLSSALVIESFQSPRYWRRNRA